MRAALDAALLTRPADCPTASAAYERFRLGEAHGIALADVKRYAALLERFARPVMASLAVSSLLKALPPRMLGGLTKGSRLIVWSRLVQYLTDPKAPPMKAADFAKLSALLQPARRTLRPRPAPGRVEIGRSRYWRGGDGEAPPESVKTVTQEVYGVNLAEDLLKDLLPSREGDPQGSSDPERG